MNTNQSTNLVVTAIRGTEGIIKATIAVPADFDESKGVSIEEYATKQAYKDAGLRRQKTDVVTVVETAPATKSRTRVGKYQAKTTGKLTAANGFARSGWEGSTVVTVKEKAILSELFDMLEMKQPDADDWSFSDVASADIADACGMTVNQVNGALSVLVAKGMVTTRSEKVKAEGRNAKMRLVFLTSYGAGFVNQEGN
jgi:hypothetical protein